MEFGNINEELERIFNSNEQERKESSVVYDSVKPLENEVPVVIPDNTVVEIPIVISNDNMASAANLIEVPNDGPFVEKNNEKVVIKLDSSQTNMVGWLVYSAAGTKSLDTKIIKTNDGVVEFTIYNKKNNEQGVDNSRFIGIVEHLYDFYDEKINYGLALNDYAGFTDAYNLIKFAMEKEGDFTFGFKKRNDSNIFAFDTNNDVLKYAFLISGIDTVSNEDHVRCSVGKGLSNEEVSEKIKRVIENLSQRTMGFNNESANTGQLLLIVICIVEILSVAVSAYFMCK